MADDADTVAGARVFRGTDPITAEFFEDRVIDGTQGAYKALLYSQGKSPAEVGNSTKGDTNVLGAVCFDQNKEGQARGASFLMAGKVHLTKVTNNKLWPDATRERGLHYIAVLTYPA